MNLLERIEIPAAEGRAVRLVAGQFLRVIDVQGAQVADLFAVVERDEWLSASHTRAMTSRLFPLVGEAFYTNRRRAILALASDDSPGVHDMLIAACDPERYQLLGAEAHASCADNLRSSLAPFGLAGVPVPQPVNLFMRLPVSPDGRLTWEPAPTKAGDSVMLRVELDCVVSVSACPQDLIPINGDRPTPIGLEVLDTTSRRE